MTSDLACRITDLPLWAERREPSIARQIERLAPLARELAERAHPSPITVADVRIAAENRGWLTGEERGRRLSWLGAVMKAAGLVATGQFVRSPLPRAHGNLLQTWRLPADG